MKTLSVKDALEKGYESYFYNSDGWQKMKYISDIQKDPAIIDWNRDDIFIVEKTAQQCVSLGKDELKDLIVDYFESQYYDVTNNDDANVVNDSFSEFNFKPFEESIEKILEGITSYRSTDIKLIP